MSHGGFNSLRQNRLRYRFKHKALGLCDRCNNKVAEGKTRCQVHINKQKIYNKKFMEKQKCGNVKIVE